MPTNVEVTIIATIVVLLVAALGWALHKNAEHEQFLRSHGCQLLTDAPTGRHIYCGKACFRPERVCVYECIDGTRTEVR